MTQRRQGFTLIEAVVSMVLLGIVGLGFFMALAYGVQQYLTSASEAALAQKSLLALTRMYVELAEIDNIDPSKSGQINGNAFYYLDHNGEEGSLARSGNSILQNGQYALVDGLSSYGSGQALFTYEDLGGNTWTPSDGFDDLYKITILLRLDSPWGEPMTFTHIVNPRHTTIPNAPKLE